jgi:hypothetical protein
MNQVQPHEAFKNALMADDAPTLLALIDTHPEHLHHFVAFDFDDVAPWLGSVDEEDAVLPALYPWHAAAWLNKPQVLLALLGLPEPVLRSGRCRTWPDIDGVEESLATLMARNGMHECLDQWFWSSSPTASPRSFRGDTVRQIFAPGRKSDFSRSAR